jgi:Tetracyclin repressor-like, C-terminal domain
VKPTTPVRKKRRRPTRSPRRAPVISSTANASVYVAPSHCSVVALPAGTLDVSDAPDPARWREQLTSVLTRIVESMDAHPGIARVPLANPPTGPNSARVAEYVLALRGEQEGDLPAAPEREFSRLDPDEFPNFTRMQPFITKGSGEERFAFGLQLMIDGLLHTPPRP